MTTYNIVCFVEPFGDDNACEIVAMCTSIMKECHSTLEFLTAAGNHSADKSAMERDGTTGLESSHQALVEETTEHTSIGSLFFAYVIIFKNFRRYFM